MIDFKAMTTPMTTNLNLLNDDTLEAIDATLYRRIIGSLMYLTNKRPDICFIVNTSIYGESQTYLPSWIQTCDEVSKGDFRLWYQICIKWRDQITWTFRFRLGRTRKI